MKKQIICALTSATMCLCLFGCGSSDSVKTGTVIPASVETTEKTYNIDTSYKFHEMSMDISDEWTTEESYDKLTVTCKEDNSYMLIMLSDANNISKGSQIYDACASNEGYQDISVLKQFDYPLYTFDFTQSSTGDPIETYYFVKDKVCYFIAVPKTISGEDSIIYENIDDVLLPVKTWIMSCAALQKSIDDNGDNSIDTGFLFD